MRSDGDEVAALTASMLAVNATCMDSSHGPWPKFQEVSNAVTSLTSAHNYSEVGCHEKIN